MMRLWRWKAKQSKSSDVGSSGRGFCHFCHWFPLAPLVRSTSRGTQFWRLYPLKISIRVPGTRQGLDRTFGASSLTRRAAYSGCHMPALIFALSITEIHASAIYSVTDLGSTRGSSAAAFGINASGMAVGWAKNAIGSTSAFASGKGALLHLPGVSSASDSFAYGVNAFLLANGMYQDLGTVSTIRNEEL